MKWQDFHPGLSVLGVMNHHQLQGEKWSVKVACQGFWPMLPPLFISPPLEKELKSVVGLNNISFEREKVK